MVSSGFCKGVSGVVSPMMESTHVITKVGVSFLYFKGELRGHRSEAEARITPRALKYSALVSTPRSSSLSLHPVLA